MGEDNQGLWEKKMKKEAAVAAVLLCLLQGCEPEKKNPVYSDENSVYLKGSSYNHLVEYVGFRISSPRDDFLNDSYFQKSDLKYSGRKLFRKEDLFGENSWKAKLITFNMDTLEYLKFQADTYPFTIEELKKRNPNWEIGKDIIWEWEFWHLTELKIEMPYLRGMEWALKQYIGSDNKERDEEENSRKVLISFPNENDSSIIEAKFPCPRVFESGMIERSKLRNNMSFWRVGVTLSDGNRDRLGLPNFQIATDKGNIKGLPIQITCGDE